MPFKLQTPIPSPHSAYRGFHWGEDGRIYVWTWETPGDGNLYFYDVSNPSA